MWSLIIYLVAKMYVEASLAESTVLPILDVSHDIMNFYIYIYKYKHIAREREIRKNQFGSLVTLGPDP